MKYRQPIHARRDWLHREARYCRFGIALVGSVALTLVACTDVSTATPSRVQFLPASQHVTPALHTCNDPENPCHSASDMQDYWTARTRKFYHLCDSFHFPKSFVLAAVRAHHKMVEREERSHRT